VEPHIVELPTELPLWLGILYRAGLPELHLVQKQRRLQVEGKHSDYLSKPGIRNVGPMDIAIFLRRD
jgi:hypothetical protein